MSENQERPKLTEEERAELFARAYEYILSDQWGKGTPSILFEEIKRMKKRMKKKDQNQSTTDKGE